MGDTLLRKGDWSQLGALLDIFLASLRALQTGEHSQITSLLTLRLEVAIALASPSCFGESAQRGLVFTFCS